MVTQIVRAICFDLARAAEAPAYFEAGKKDRESTATKRLGEYPESLVSYLVSVKGGDFAEDASALFRVLASGESVITEASRLAGEKNGLFVAMLDGLNAIRSYRSDKTELGRVLSSFDEAEATYAHVLDRELQNLLLVATGKDSPIVQVAAPVELDVSELPGVPSVSVRRTLLGGARTFYEGELKDESWRARLTEVLSVVS